MGAARADSPEAGGPTDAAKTAAPSGLAPPEAAPEHSAAKIRRMLRSSRKKRKRRQGDAGAVESAGLRLLKVREAECQETEMILSFLGHSKSGRQGSGAENYDFLQGDGGRRLRVLIYYSYEIVGDDGSS